MGSSSGLAKARFIPDPAMGSGPGQPFVFQYNPESLKRSVGSGPVLPDLAIEAGSVPDWEFLQFEAVLDATDAMESAHRQPIAATQGVLPRVSQLESILRGDARNGPPKVRLEWGPGRSFVVNLVRLIVREEAFNRSLYPIRVRLEFLLRVSIPVKGRPRDGKARSSKPGRTIASDRSNR